MTELAMPITALLPWYGSKRTLAPRIIAELGHHTVYVEPFCGSMAVFLQKPRCNIEVVNDLNEKLIDMARIMRDRQAGPIFYRRVKRYSMHDGVIDDAKAILNDPNADRIDRAAAYFAMSWIGLNGYSGTDEELVNVNTARRYTLLGGGSPTTRFRSATKSVWAFAKRLRGVDVRCEDAIELVARMAPNNDGDGSDKPGVVFYVDPPYLKKGAKYLHDFDWLAHRRLAKELMRYRNARIVVSYYDHPDLAALYPGWTKIDCSLTKALASQGRRDSTHNVKAPEVLLVNGPSFATEAA